MSNVFAYDMLHKQVLGTCKHTLDDLPYLLFVLLGINRNVGLGLSTAFTLCFAFFWKDGSCLLLVEIVLVFARDTVCDVSDNKNSNVSIIFIFRLYLMIFIFGSKFDMLLY